MYYVIYNEAFEDGFQFAEYKTQKGALDFIKSKLPTGSNDLSGFKLIEGRTIAMEAEVIPSVTNLKVLE